MPHFIITYGPAGSGKGFIKENYIQWLNNKYPNMKIDATNTVVAEIDNFVESDPVYKTKVFECVCTFIDECKINVSSTDSLRDHLVNVLNDWGDSTKRCSASRLSKELTAIYKTARIPKNSALDALIVAGVAANKNVIFESTGQYATPLDWLWRCGSDWNGPLCKNMAYTKTIVFPYVNEDTVLQRAKDRFSERVIKMYDNLKKCSKSFRHREIREAFECFEAAKAGTPPRLPDIPELQENIQKAQQHLVPYITNQEISHVLLIDNNNPRKVMSYVDLVSPTALNDEEFVTNDKEFVTNVNAFVDVYGNGLTTELRDVLNSALKGANYSEQLTMLTGLN